MLHKCKKSFSDFVKLISLIILGQYLIQFKSEDIDKFNELDKELKETGKSNPRIKSNLTELKTYQKLDLDVLIKKLYSSSEPLFVSKDLNNLSKMRLEGIMLYSLKSNQIMFHYSFCYVFKLL